MRHRVELQGHRGARGLFPENTIEGLVAALAIGVDALEVDVAVTADGVPVLSHDPALNPALVRGPEGAWLAGPGPLIRTLPLAGLACFDVGRARPGSAEAARFPDQRACDGARIPTLAQALAVDPAVRFTIELKTYPDQPDWTVAPETMADAVLAVVEAAGAAHRVTVESFDWRGPRHLRRRRSDLSLAWLTRPETVAQAASWWGGPRPEEFGGSVPRAVAAEGGATWAPDHADLTVDQIAEARALGLKVLAWTVNAADRMRDLVRAGIDGIITDRPDIARRVLAAEGLALPPVRER
jgi:glycerophosphoryl diester phosphodiesterase